MPTIDVASKLQGLLKERYAHTMYNTIVNRTQVLDLFKESASQVHDGPDGKYWKFSNLAGGLQGIGSRQEGALLPEGGTPIFLNPIFRLKYHYARIDFTFQAIQKAVEGPSAFGSFARTALVPSVENLTDDLDRQAVGFGAGILCKINGAPTQAAVPIASPFGITSTTKGWLNVKRGMQVVAGPNADGSGLRSGGASATVFAVDPTANSGGGAFAVDVLPSDWASGDFLFRGDAYGNNIAVNGLESELIGIEGLFDNGTILDTMAGISRAATPEWKSVVIDASAAPYSGQFTDGLAMRAVTDAQTVGGGRVDTFLTDHDSMRQLYNAIRLLGGFGTTRDGQTAKAGAKGISIETPLGSMMLRSVPRLAVGRAFAMDSTSLHRFKDGDGQWVDLFSGSIFGQQMVGGAVRDAGFAYYRVPLELGCDDPKKNVKITGISAALY